MQTSEYENIYKNESSHFFYVSNHNIIISLVKKYLKVPPSKAKILDAGCGTGLLAKKLGRFGKVCGIDINTEAIKYAKKRGARVKQGSVNKLPFKKDSFNLIVSLDVLYHKQVNDAKALEEFYRVLKPGGLVIVRVPANKWLHLNHDKHVHTRQRYSTNEIKRKIINSGFEVKRISYVNMILLPLAVIKQFAESVTPKEEISSGVSSESKLLNDILLSLLSMESKIITYFDLPFGLGIVVVAQKPSK
ncbi:MAG: class I SAM-dependent methyltransferase [Candidatus Blackburnbacteria bacterium]|nr:class I SAM-dependent methyltransferase [Candidatus Blackburnbacteria bacterium]